MLNELLFLVLYNVPKFYCIWYFRSVLKTFRGNNKKEMAVKVKKFRLDWIRENPGTPEDDTGECAFEWALKHGLKCSHSPKYTKHFINRVK